MKKQKTKKILRRVIVGALVFSLVQSPLIAAASFSTNEADTVLTLSTLYEDDLESEMNTFSEEVNATTSNIIYLTRGDETSQDGDGSLNRPYQSLSYALEQAQNGDTIKLVDNVTFRRDSLNVPYLINKNVVIDGTGVDGSSNYSLTLRGINLELGADLELKNLTLNIITDRSVQSAIYLNGHSLVLDNISTKIGDRQDDERPVVYANSSGRNGSGGTWAKLELKNGGSELRFKKIDLNLDYAKLIVDSEFSKVDEAVVLNAHGIEIESNSKNIKKYIGNNELTNSLTFKQKRISNISIENIQQIKLTDAANVTLSDLIGDSILDLKVDANSVLTMPNTNTETTYQVENLSGSGSIELQKNNRINLATVEDPISISIYGFESDLATRLNKTFISVSLSGANNISPSFKTGTTSYNLVNENGNFVLKSSQDLTMADQYNPQARDITKTLGEAITEADLRAAILGIPTDVDFLYDGDLPDGNSVISIEKEIEIAYTDDSRDLVNIRLQINDLDRSSYYQTITDISFEKQVEIGNANISEERKNELNAQLEALQQRYEEEIRTATNTTQLNRIVNEASTEIRNFVVPQDEIPDNVNTDNGNTDNGNTDNSNTNNGNTDNGNTNNGNTDNGNTNNGNSDNGNTDNGNTNNGNTDNGNTDNGNTDNGNSDNGNTNNGNSDNDNTNNNNNSGSTSGISSSGSSNTNSGGSSSSSGGSSSGGSSGGGSSGGSGAKVMGSKGSSIVNTIAKAGIYITTTNSNIYKNDAYAWQKDQAGIWHYYINASALKETWLYYKNSWYYLDKNSNMLSHTWIKDKDKWYYVNKDGVLATKQWILVDAKWYYAKDGGDIIQNAKEIIDGKEYSFDASGAYISK